MNATQKNKPLAHMFWDGTLTTYQKASILSAHNAGFHVILWSFDKHDLPKEIEQRNAEEILSRGAVDHLSYLGWHKGQSVEHRARALYSDFFRAEVIDQLGGWWFDTDILFFKTAYDFERMLEGRKIIAGQEPHTHFSVNNAVLAFGDKKFATLYKMFLYKIAEGRHEFKWGEFGPGALNKMFSRLDINDQVVEQKAFYPITVNDRKHMYATTGFARKHCIEQTKDSYCLHWWNSSEFNKKSGYSLQPPQTSFLGLHFKKVFEEFARNNPGSHGYKF